MIITIHKRITRNSTISKFRAVSMINAADGSEFTYSGIPSDSFMDSDDPDYSKYFSFALDGTTVPNNHTSQ